MGGGGHQRGPRNPLKNHVYVLRWDLEGETPYNSEQGRDLKLSKCLSFSSFKVLASVFGHFLECEHESNGKNAF